jgi:hypothetical protein
MSDMMARKGQFSKFTKGGIIEVQQAFAKSMKKK